MEISNVSAIQISLLVGLLATLFGLVPGVWLAWILARKDFPGKSLLNVVVFFPMVSPPLVTGYLLLKMLGRNSVIGSMLSQFGLAIPFSLLVIFPNRPLQAHLLFLGAL
jgi:molybdate transport system permease protein